MAMMIMMMMMMVVVVVMMMMVMVVMMVMMTVVDIVFHTKHLLQIIMQTQTKHLFASDALKHWTDTVQGYYVELTFFSFKCVK